MGFKDTISARLINAGLVERLIRMPDPWPRVTITRNGYFNVSTEHAGHWRDLYSWDDQFELVNQIVDYATQNHTGKAFWIHSYEDQGNRHVAVVLYTQSADTHTWGDQVQTHMFY